MTTTNPQDKKRRRIRIISVRFQVGLMAKFIVANAVMLALCGLGLHAFLRGEIQASLQSAHAVYRTVGEMLSPIIVTLILLSWGILSIATVVVILFASHRIAGPIYRFQQALREMQGRKLDPLTRIRKDDQIGEVALDLERVRDLWAADIAQLRRLAGELRGALAAESTSPTAQNKLAELQAVLDAYSPKGG